MGERYHNPNLQGLIASIFGTPVFHSICVYFHIHKYRMQFLDGARYTSLFSTDLTLS